MQITTVDVVYPIWLRITILAFVLYPIIVPVLVRNRSDLRLVALVPAVLGVWGSSMGLGRLVTSLSMYGRAPSVAAAGSGESLILALLGCGLAALLAVVILLPSFAEGRKRRLSITSVIAGIVSAILVAQLIVIAHMIRSPQFSAGLHAAVIAVAVASSCLLLVSIVALLLRAHPLANASRVWFVSFAAGDVIVASFLGLVVHALKIVAIGGA